MVENDLGCFVLIDSYGMHSGIVYRMGLFVLDDFYVVPILSAAFWPVGLPMCIGFIIAKYLLLRYGERNEISR